MKLEVRNVSKTYGKVKALDNISVCFKQGIYGILGPNGAGKSTLINILTDNIVRDSGEVLFNDAEILKMGKEYRKLVAPLSSIYPQSFSILLKTNPAYFSGSCIKASTL